MQPAGGEGAQDHEDREGADLPRDAHRRGGGQPPRDFIEDKKIASPLEHAIRTTVHAGPPVLNTLTTARKRSCRGFGIGENTDHTLEEVGQEFDVTASASADRGKGAPEAPPPEPEQAAQELHGVTAVP